MGRKTTTAPPKASFTEAVSKALPRSAVGSVPAITPMEPEIVPEGDFAGMKVDDVVAALNNQVQDIIGEVTIETAGCVLDKTVSDFLTIAQFAKGDRFAKVAGLNFIETALPFALLDVDSEMTLNEWRKKRIK